MTGTLDTFGTALAAVLTVLVLLYAVGDNPLFRLAIHLFIGVAAGYAGAVAVTDVILPRLAGLGGSQSGVLVAVLLMLMLFMKISPRTAPLGNPASGFLVGVGAAVAIGGAVRGTILPQVSSAGDFFGLDFFQGSVALIGVIAVLVHFNFTARRAPNQIPERSLPIRIVSSVGQAFIAVTFGVIFAGVFSAALTALIERFKFLSSFISSFL